MVSSSETPLLPLRFRKLPVGRAGFLTVHTSYDAVVPGRLHPLWKGNASFPLVVIGNTSFLLEQRSGLFELHQSDMPGA